ncbi:MAG: cupin domain-containing protein [Gammaproteobacteria bacterium]|nr:cupin domain-containing protein [Gammaproteobacteria bacterium]
MKDNNIFASIPQCLDQELVEILLKNKDVCIERIISKGHTSPDTGWYDQPKNEWVMVLKGEAVIAFQGEPEIRLAAGSYIDIAAHKKHRVSWTDPNNETIWLAVHYPS